MPRRVIFAPRALRQFNAQLAYLADRSRTAGGRLILRMIDAARRQLADFPRNAPRAAAPGTRRLIVPPYVLTYREHSSLIEIIDFRHGRQAPYQAPRELASEDESDAEEPE
jgi:plasmid stabilization system protein ParE